MKLKKQKNVYDFSDYDYIIQEGEKRDVKFIINLGWRLPAGQNVTPSMDDK